MQTLAAYNVATIVAIGMGITFLIADWRSVSSRLLAAFIVLTGVAVHDNAGFGVYDDVASLPWWVKTSGVPIALALLAGGQWMLRVRATIPAGELKTSFGDNVIRLGQAAAILYGLLTLIFWERRAEWLILRLGELDAVLDHTFILITMPFFLSLFLLSVGILITLRRKPDWPEMVRLLGFVASAPFFAMTFVLPFEYGVYSITIGLMIFMIGAVEYHMVQGQRGQFMARFLSPQVANLVRKQGLSQTIADVSTEISVVYCDIRGFTAYAEHSTPETVIDILREYYDAVGEAAHNHGATIKDYAGDGVLLLVGAPLPCEDYADRALWLAQEIMRQAGRVVEKHNQTDQQLGLGIGVATGQVSVGVVGGNRLEYVAVGSAVNLSARLCSHAAGGEIVVDQRTRELLSDNAKLREGEPVELKGFNGLVPNFLLS